jgi:sulfatase maturation enzyme AslB (radical SAM superfamily)
VRVTLSGETTFHEIVTALHAFTDDALYDDTFHILFDVRNITRYLTYLEMQSLFDYYKTNLNDRINGKIAVLITHTVQYGITRIASTIFGLKGIDVDAFYTEEDALRWFQN